MNATPATPVSSIPLPAQPVPEAPSVVMFPSGKFVLGCAVLAVAILCYGVLVSPPPVWLLATEIFSTIIGLFLFGSFKYQIHKNALTYGMCMVVCATFFPIWWPASGLHQNVNSEGLSALLPFLAAHLLSWQGLDELIHSDTMLFILGLTFFVCVIAQTRILETATLALLRRNKGFLLPTVLAVTAAVAFSSGILDGVSMIGLTIRTLVIILLLARANSRAISFAVMLCTVVTTVCGMWLAYGEPPNLIMKSNLIAANGESYLSNAFFLRYCLPGAVASFGVIGWNLWRKLKGARVELATLDVLDEHAATVRFLQAQRHGEVITPIELIEHHAAELNGKAEAVLARLHGGEPLGVALVREEVPEAARRKLLGAYISEDLAESLDQHYVFEAAGDHANALAAEKNVDAAIAALAPERSRAQKIGALGLAVFVVLLVGHGVDHRMPLFVAPLLGFLVALSGIWKLPKVRALAIHEARAEYAEYYFLLPLFLSMTLLTHVGFFDQLHELLASGINSAGKSHVAFAQFLGCTFLSAILDNNIVADFGSRALHGLELGVLHLFAMAQIAGYAAGGCWTHIGCAQSVVAFAFIRRDVEPNFSPMNWIREMTPIMLQLIFVLTLLIYFEGLILG